MLRFQRFLADLGGETSECLRSTGAFVSFWPARGSILAFSSCPMKLFERLEKDSLVVGILSFQLCVAENTACGMGCTAANFVPSGEEGGREIRI